MLVIAGRRARARRSLWASKSACARVHKAGANFWLISRLLGLRRHPSRLLAPLIDCCAINRRPVGEPALGFWKAIDKILPGAGHQRCWFHKATNILNHFQKSMSPAVTEDQGEISDVANRAAAQVVIEIFKEEYAAK